MKESFGFEHTWWVPASVFVAVLLISNIFVSLSVLYFFITTIYIPGHFIVFFLIGKQESESLLFIPAGFALIPLLAYLSGILSIPLVSPSFPLIFSAICLALMHKHEDVERIKDRIIKELGRRGLL